MRPLRKSEKVWPLGLGEVSDGTVMGLLHLAPRRGRDRWMRFEPRDELMGKAGPSIWDIRSGSGVHDYCQSPNPQGDSVGPCCDSESDRRRAEGPGQRGPAATGEVCLECIQLAAAAAVRASAWDREGTGGHPSPGGTGRESVRGRQDRVRWPQRRRGPADLQWPSRPPRNADCRPATLRASPGRRGRSGDPG